MKKIGCIIPIRGIELGKQRIRKELPKAKDSQISALIFRILENVINKCSLFFNPIWVMTKDPESLEDRLKRLNVNVVKDPNSNLNDSLFRIAYNLAPTIDSIAVIAPDLPLLQSHDILTLVNSQNESTGTIAPSKDVGTSGLIFPLNSNSFPCNFKFMFGENSFKEHIEAFSKIDLNYNVVRSRGFLWDLDTIEDLQNIMKTHPKHLSTNLAENIQLLLKVD